MSQANASEARDVFIAGLKNAHAMERQALSIMSPQIDRIDSYPEVKDRLVQHKRETEAQVERLESVLDALGEKPSVMKDAALSIAGGMAALGHTPAPDEILKNSFANFAFENYEIAAYNSLIVLAEAAGVDDAVEPLQQNLVEEEAMAAWLESNLASVTEKYVALREAGETAKR
jgi:ferritin-like metal-binding protein YciE